MSINRIQKLLFSEYCDFEDMVLVESSFAQTTREGKGIRQVHLGLTPTKLVLATDILPSAKESSVIYIPGIDPDIETFELIAVYPVECVNLSIFHHRKRKSLKAHFCNNRILYFELGGYEKRNMFWNLWCERVKFLSPEDPGSSHSETSVATSTSNSTLYLLVSRKVVTEKGVPQIWCKFGSGDSCQTNKKIQKWTDRYLFLGAQLDESPLNYAPGMLPPTISQFVHSRKKIERHKTLQKDRLAIRPSLSESLTRDLTSTGELYPVNRFASGVIEGCSTSLFLPAENYIVPRRFSETTTMVHSTDVFSNNSMGIDFNELAESSVRLWELYKETDPNRYKRRHKRRYGISAQPHFLHGLGPWNVAQGARFSIQVKRAVSAVSIRRQPTEPELRLAVSKRQLVATVSCETLHLDGRLNANTNTIKNAPKGPVIFFWTPEYWYRPRAARDAYQELQEHLNKIRQYHQTKENSIKKEQKCKKRKLFRRKKVEKEISDSDSEDISPTKSRRRLQLKASSKLFNIFSNKHEQFSTKEEKKEPQETSIQFLRRLLRMDVALTAWDFDSTTLAHQLTIIDKELFLKIPPSELGVLIWQQSSKNAPNIGALIAFSHRISCLVATEVLRDDSEKIRARLVARFINTADKCNKIYNFQSCKSVLCGLQSPSIYRLRETWTYVRKKHATKYQIFENLCRLYRDPRLPAYQKVFFRATQNTPYLPFIGDLIARLLDRVPEFGDNLISRTTISTFSKQNIKITDRNSNTAIKLPEDTSVMTMLRKILSTLKVWPTSDTCHEIVKKQYPEKRRRNILAIKGKIKGLTDYYKPLDCYEDNRIQRLNEAIELLEKFQRAASDYAIGKNELAREYLLKARYREDRENFFNSFGVESSNCISMYTRNK